MQISTTKCSARQHREFSFEFDSAIPRHDVDILVSYLEQSVESGTRFEDGQTIQFGSMILRVVAANDFLILEEPNLQSIPIVWTVGVIRSLKLLRLQKNVAESVGLLDELDSPSIRHSLLVGADLTEESNSFVLERLEPQGSDSGWFIGKLDSRIDYNDAANLRRISVYQAILNWPHVAGFLTLPSGCRVETSSEQLEVSRYGQQLEIQKKSLLDAALTMRKLTPGKNPN